MKTSCTQAGVILQGFVCGTHFEGIRKPVVDVFEETLGGLLNASFGTLVLWDQGTLNGWMT